MNAVTGLAVILLLLALGVSMLIAASRLRKQHLRQSSFAQP